MGLFQGFGAVASSGVELDMVLEFDTSLGDLTIEMPLAGTVDCTIDWGDGNSDSYTTTGIKTHTYASGGTYTVRVSGTLTQFGSSTVGARPELTKCLSFGEIGLTGLGNAFRNCSNLTVVPDLLPQLSSVTGLASTFRDATSFNYDIGGWDVSTVTGMFGVFYGATSFNQDISGWDVSSVTSMGNMFRDATSFNQDISVWDMSSGPALFSMFNGATSFDQDLGSWDVSSITTMDLMFVGVTLSTGNYDGILQGWAAQTVQPNVPFHGGNSQYSAGAATTARGVLTGSPNNWAITDGGQV